MTNRSRQAGPAVRKGKNRKRNSKRSAKNRIGNICLAVQALLSILFFIVIVLLNMLPLNYLSMIAAVLFFLWCISFTSQVLRRGRGITGKLYSFVMIFVLAVGTFYIAKTNHIIASITGGFSQVDNMVVAVLADDPAETLEDAADYSFGVQFARGADNMQTAITDIQDQLGTDIDMTEYDSIQDQAGALFNGDVQAIIYNAAYAGILEETYPDFKNSVKIISRLQIRSELNLGGSASDDTLIKAPFTVYISGIDTYGEVSETSRSDVNIIAVVNPVTNQILLVTTPRDYFVPIPGISEGQNDKLTHAGAYGIDASMATLGELYETDINYYVRLNFTSMIDIIDTLGGIDVYSDLAFSTGPESGYEMDVSKGYNHFNGKQALAFCRERHNLADGDVQRGKNQQAVITAMLKKILSPTMLLKANGILNQISKDIETNVTQGQLNTLIKNQLSTNAEWTIQSVAATGTDGEDYCYSAMNELLYVMYPDEDVVKDIIELANVVEEGGTLKKGETLN